MLAAKRFGEASSLRGGMANPAPLQLGLFGPRF